MTYEEQVGAVLKAMGVERVLATDPRVIAVEAAVFANRPEGIAQSAMDRLPANATQFERGIAYGMAIFIAAGSQASAET